MENVSISSDKIEELFSVSEQLNNINDLELLLEQILYNARTFTNADAGTIYLLEGEKLHFSYCQNDTLSKRDQFYNKQTYSNATLPVNFKSISGYVALMKEPLVIDDAYAINGEYPFLFNRQYDDLTDYRTKSILTVPLYTNFGKVVGVMQIINAKDKNGEVISFTESDKIFVSFFATSASVAIEKAKMTREMILRMIKMAELRDPKETGTHVNRVGAYSVEIYQQWAKSRGVSDEEIYKTKDILRISSMLHDVGKIAIPDAILKKTGKLDDAEYSIMKTHTFAGADLFKNNFSHMDEMSYDVAFSHHERWDGKGYPNGLRGEDIPVGGRIVAIADVYDALISKRAYKESWDESEVIDYLRENAGSQFDPDMIDAFLSIYDIIKAIREKYKD